MKPYDHNADYHGIWERRTEETDLQYERFQAYLHMKERNMTTLGKQLNVSAAYLRNVASKMDWTERVSAYDRFISAEIERKTAIGAIAHVNSDTASNDEWIDAYSKMQKDAWNTSERLMGKIADMLEFEVGNATKSARTVKRTKDADGNPVLEIVGQTKVDPRWTWADVTRMVEMVNELRRMALGLPADVVRIMPDFVYELRRHGRDPIDFMKLTIETLRAS